ncbi:glycosyltransferase involved in cell wall biosynthesis [Gracilibacillus halotolerans]|uniref:Glycosyltransferase involved in cell wall biosynthesis n=1 Tax=Gracilibacillus halotolerans TaxID=74386 RepID=A0A841RN50_9BACI|nr:glycosyltransferase [Gracilibacillus halotolerans]MBB6512866.1 glycosyltransferase involved in cell wall biosynthesis [Gracilibacillus halotolerans]
MKAVLVSCFNYYDNRLKFIQLHLENMGYDVTYITSDYDHINKERYNLDRKGTIQVRVPRYKNNLSIKRIYSHYTFSKKVYKKIKEIKPDILYVMLPPNYLGKIAATLRKKNDIKLIFDVYDLWPETFPSLAAKKTLTIPFLLWRNLRNKNLRKADFVITECKLYQRNLQGILNEKETDVLYLTKETKTHNIINEISANKMNICYLGSINNIIDIPLIAKTLAEIHKLKPVTLHIIGDGEKREDFIKEVSKFGVTVQFHGKIYDEKIKSEILGKCNFGINIMKKTVCVGLTMKSIDYFASGLPIINNIKADTFELVEKYKIGINVSEERFKEVAELVAGYDLNELSQMKKNTMSVFKELFSITAFNAKSKSILEKVIKS